MSKRDPLPETVPPRRSFLEATLLGAASAALLPAFAAARETNPGAAPQNIPAFELDETTLADLQQGIASGQFTSRSLVEKYLARIDALDKRGPGVNSIIELNPFEASFFFCCCWCVSSIVFVKILRNKKTIRGKKGGQFYQHQGFEEPKEIQSTTKRTLPSLLSTPKKNQVPKLKNENNVYF